jgi:hypothetical protein
MSLETKRKIILFIPGYYGSTLVSKKSGKLRWVKFSDFFFHKKNLTMTVRGTSIQASEELIPGEVLTHVNIIPYLFKIDSYGKTLSQLSAFARRENYTVETAIYDWRDDFISSLKRIDEKIKSLTKNKNVELHIVAHSTGALLMSYYLRYGSQDVIAPVENWEGARLIHKAVLAAAPFHGLMVLLRDTEHGTTKGLNNEMLSAKDYSSFKSSYMFLPPKGEDIGLHLKTNNEIELKLHDSATWEKNRWGIFKFLSEKEFPAGRIFIEECMSRSQQFHDLLRAPIKNSPPENFSLLYLSGKGHKTVQLALVSEDEAAKRQRVDFNLPETNVDGDGTVTAASGRPLEFFKKLNHQFIETEDSHLNVVAKASNQHKIQAFLKN